MLNAEASRERCLTNRSCLKPVSLFDGLPLIPLAERKFQGLADVALVWDTAATGGGAKSAEKFVGNAEIYRLLLGLEFEGKRLEVLRVEVV